ncbi:MAG: hypothetical protein IT165_23245 [Bryobacterales bacterium]|nr:hypothetical protein [Bryobacterales bacterium]
MRKTWLALWMTAAAALPLAAQQRGMYGGVSTGKIVGSFDSTGFASGLGATVSSLPQTNRLIPLRRPGIYANPVRGARGGYGGGGRARTVVVPYGIPYGFVGSGYGGAYTGYDGGAPAQSVVEPAPQSPTVIINQYYSPDVVRPQIKEYTDLPEAVKPKGEETKQQATVYPPGAQEEVTPERVVSATKPTLTLLAFRDSTVVAVIAYWVDGQDLHYVTKGYAKKVVPLETLDKGVSLQLNSERGVEFSLE